LSEKSGAVNIFELATKAIFFLKNIF